MQSFIQGSGWPKSTVDRICILIIGAIALIAGPVNAEQNKLKALREAVKNNRIERLEASGQVTAVNGNTQIMTNITGADLQLNKFTETDMVRLTIGKKKVTARIFTTAVYRSLTQPDPENGTWESDARAVCLVDSFTAGSTMEIHDPMGGLSEWANARLGTPVAVEKADYKTN